MQTSRHPSGRLSNIISHNNDISNLLSCTPRFSRMPQSGFLPTVVPGYPTTQEGRRHYVYVSSEILTLTLVPDSTMTNAAST